MTVRPDDTKWLKGIKSVISYINQNDWVVVFKANVDSQAHLESKTIQINSRHPIRVKYYILLHELGHMLCMDDANYVSPVTLHGPKYNTLVYRVERVKEEFSAWDKGEEAARMFGWPMDKYFYVIRAKLLSSYMMWASDRRIKNIIQQENAKKVQEIHGKHTSESTVEDSGRARGSEERSGGVSAIQQNESV